MRKKGLTEKQIQILQTLNNKNRINRCSSIFAFMLEHKNKQTGKLEISLYNLEQKYNLNRKRACLQTIKNAAKKFIELDLMSLEKVNGKNIYIFNSEYTKGENNDETL